MKGELFKSEHNQEMIKQSEAIVVGGAGGKVDSTALITKVNTGIKKCSTAIGHINHSSQLNHSGSMVFTALKPSLSSSEISSNVSKQSEENAGVTTLIFFTPFAGSASRVLEFLF